VSKVDICSCCERLEQAIRGLDAGLAYSRKLDGYNDLQEIVDLAKAILQAQLRECKYCERNQRPTGETQRLDNDPWEFFRERIPRRP
jgi:hypothetical protein